VIYSLGGGGGLINNYCKNYFEGKKIIYNRGSWSHKKGLCNCLEWTDPNMGWTSNILIGSIGSLTNEYNFSNLIRIDSENNLFVG